jgi:hypothetical protein
MQPGSERITGRPVTGKLSVSYFVERTDPEGESPEASGGRRKRGSVGLLTGSGESDEVLEQSRATSGF